MTTVAELAVVLSADISGLTNGLQTAENRISTFGGTLRSIGGSLQSFGGAVTTLFGPAAAGIGLATNAAIDFESAFAGVIKTVDATDAELATLREGIRAMATDTENPVAALDNAAVTLAGIAESAGQLGVAREDILGFTETIGQLTMATNLTAEDAATMAARFANIAQMDLSNIDRFGATIVDLGNNSATTEGEILAMGLRLAAAGTAAGMSEADILGVSAAMSSLGLEAEAGGTAMTRVINEMVTAAATGGPELEAFASTAGMTGDAFAAMFESDPTGALLAFITGLEQLDAASQISVMENLGLNDIRVADTLRRLSGDSELLATSLGIASEAWQENTALTEEAGKRAETTESQMTMFKNSLNELGITVGDILLPPLRSLIEQMQPVVESVRAWAEANPELVSQIADIAVKGALLGGALLIAGTALSAIGTIAGAAAAGVGLLLSPIGLLVAAVGVLAAVLNDSGIQQGLAAWGPAFEAIGLTLRLVGDKVKRDVETFFLNIQARITDFIANFRQRILDATGGQVDIAPEITLSNYDIERRLSEMQIADTIARTLTEQVGQAEINLGEMINVETAQASVSSTMEGLLNNPGVITNMSEAGKVAIESAISLAATNGDVGTYNALLPIATELDIPIAPMIEDNQLAVDEAALAPYDATLTVDMTVRPGAIDMTAVQAALTSRLNALANGSNGGGFGVGVAPMGIPVGHDGLMMRSDGLAYLAAGERVLNPAETQDYERGGGDTIIINAYAESPYELARMLDKARARSGVRYG
jgi:TP901 family phage tail tape measure protein